MVKFFKYNLFGIAIGTAIYTDLIFDSKVTAFLLVTLIGAWFFSIIDDIDSDTE